MNTILPLALFSPQLESLVKILMDDSDNISPSFCYHIPDSPVAKGHDYLWLSSY